MILAQLAQYLRDRRQTDPAFHLVGDGEILPGDLESESQNFGVRPSAVVEGDGQFFTKPVAADAPPGSGFTHFLDGIQRSRLVGYEGIVPLVYGFTAAIIRERRADRTMAAWKAAIVRECIYAPEAEIDADGMRERGIPLSDTSRSLNGEEACPARYRQAAVSGIQRARAEAEAQLARQWVSEVGSLGDGWLFVDGSLTFSAQHARVAGIVKSHQTQYFLAPEQAKVFRLEVGERSALFLPGFGDAEGGDVLSWYLRLHPCARRDPTYGLIRIEVDKREEVKDQVDEVSRWLLAERQPLTAPDPRWDKLLYPIRDCEEYLRSLAPSPTMMEAFLS